MTNRKLYALAITTGGQQSAQATARQRLASLGLLDSDTGSVEDIATQPGDQTLSQTYRGKYAEKMLAELDELASSSGIGAVPYHARSGSTPIDGYYTLSEAQTSRDEPKTDARVTFDGSLTREGTRQSHRRSVATSIDQANHPFGNDDRSLVGVPAAALSDSVEWYDPATGTTEAASVVGTRSAELGDVDVLDARSSSFSDPTLVYDLAYADQANVDPRVWDTRGVSKTDSDGVLAWQKVFATSHDFAGEAVLSNGLVRVVADPPANFIAVERWDDSAGQWDAQSLGASDWELSDLDLREIGLADVVARVRFRDPTQSPTDYFDLDCHLKRGYLDPLWVEPGQAGTPSGLKDLLDPASSAIIFDPGESVGLVDRSEVA